MKKHLLKIGALTISPIIALPVFISCATAVDGEGLLKQKKEIIANFATHSNLKLWDKILTDKYSQNISDFSLETSFKDENSQFFNDAWAAFDFYQSQILAKDKLFFIRSINQWGASGHLSQDGTAESNVETIAKLQSDYGQSLTKDQFKLIWTDPKTQIQEQIKKMLIAKEYLTNSTEAEIKKSKEWLENESADISNNEYHLVRTSDPDYFLNIHLLKKQISDVWEFSSTESAALATYSKFKIKSIDDFNSLSQTKISLVNEKQSNAIALETNDKIDTSKLFAYKGLKMNSGGNGDLSYTIEFLKSQDIIFTGFVDNTTSKIHSVQDFEKSPLFLNKKEVIPTLKSESKSKDKFTITVEDFSLTETDPALDHEIIGVYPVNYDKNNIKHAQVAIKMSLKGNKSASYVYRVGVNWNYENILYSPTIGKIVPEISTSISVLSEDEQSIKATYVNKIVPLATEVVTVGEGDKKRVEAFFSLAKTPWSTKEQKTRLAFSLIMLTDSMLTSALAFYEDQGYKITDKNSDIFGDENKKQELDKETEPKDKEENALPTIQ